MISSIKLGIRSDFGTFLRSLLSDTDLRGKISEISEDVIKNFQQQNVPADILSSQSSFGIGLGLGFLILFLAKKRKGSPIARNVAKLLGVNVNVMDIDDILEKLKDQNYYITI